MALLPACCLSATCQPSLTSISPLACPSAHSHPPLHLLQAPVVPAADRETFLFFQGGCGSTNPAARPQFAAGKMLRHALVQELAALGQADIHVSEALSLLRSPPSPCLPAGRPVGAPTPSIHPCMPLLSCGPTWLSAVQRSSYRCCWRCRPLLLSSPRPGSTQPLLPSCFGPRCILCLPLQAQCACDICEGHMPHDQLMARMARSVFCPILPSNTQSSRRLSEAMLAGEGAWGRGTGTGGREAEVL